TFRAPGGLPGALRAGADGDGAAAVLGRFTGDHAGRGGSGVRAAAELRVLAAVRELPGDAVHVGELLNGRRRAVRGLAVAWGERGAGAAAGAGAGGVAPTWNPRGAVLR